MVADRDTEALNDVDGKDANFITALLLTAVGAQAESNAIGPDGARCAVVTVSNSCGGLPRFVRLLELRNHLLQRIHPASHLFFRLLDRRLVIRRSHSRILAGGIQLRACFRCPGGLSRQLLLGSSQLAQLGTALSQPAFFNGAV